MSDQTLIGSIQAYTEPLQGAIAETAPLSGAVELPALDGSVPTIPELVGALQPSLILNGHIFYQVTVNGVELFIELDDVNIVDPQNNDLIVYDAATQKYVNVPAASFGITGDLTYIHHQTIPATEWIIDHPLAKYPSVMIVDSAGTVVFGQISYEDTTQVRVQFSTAFSGSAYLN